MSEREGLVGSVEELVLRHASKVVKEAEGLRDRGISYRILIKVYKPKWERELYGLLKGLLGDLMLIGKDSGVLGRRRLGWTCLCDLLDGSLNFMCGLKYYAYSVALAKEGEVVYGIVVDLENMAYYKAERGGGAFYVDESGEEHELKEEAVRVPVNFKVLATNVTLRSLHPIELRCSALELCALARGAAEIGIGKTWTPEFAAGFLIAKESGLTFTDWDFKPLECIPMEYREVKYVCGTPKALKELSAKTRTLKDLVIEA